MINLINTKMFQLHIKRDLWFDVNLFCMFFSAISVLPYVFYNAVTRFTTLLEGKNKIFRTTDFMQQRSKQNCLSVTKIKNKTWLNHVANSVLWYK